MNPKILAVVAVTLAWLHGRHVTIWLAGRPVTLAAAVFFFAAMSALIVTGAWLIFRKARRDGSGGILTAYWRTVS